MTEQLAIACPNLEGINLRSAVNCFLSLNGLHTIVDKCQTLQGLNLVGIPVVCGVSFAFMGIIINIKKFTHLTIDLSMLIYSNADKQKLNGLLKSCNALKAPEILNAYNADGDAKDLLFSILSICQVRTGSLH